MIHTFSDDHFKKHECQTDWDISQFSRRKREGRFCSVVFYCRLLICQEGRPCRAAPPDIRQIAATHAHARMTLLQLQCTLPPSLPRSERIRTKIDRLERSRKEARSANVTREREREREREGGGNVINIMIRKDGRGSGSGPPLQSASPSAAAASKSFVRQIAVCGRRRAAASSATKSGDNCVTLLAAAAVVGLVASSAAVAVGGKMPF